MRKHLIAPIAAALFCSGLACAVTKVACVGDSITFGTGIANNEPKYPMVLAELLGDQFEVKNFGNPGKTAGDYPSQKGRTRWYGDNKEHKEAVDYKADIYICNLGINDTGAWWDPSLFKSGYETLVKAWKQANPKARLFAWGLLGPDFRGPQDKKTFPGNVFAPEYKFSGTDNGSSTHRETAEQLIGEVAMQQGVNLFDAYSSPAKHPEWYKDGLHPTAPGAKRIAEITFAHLAKALTLPMPLPKMKGNAESVTIANPGKTALVLDGWSLASPATRQKMFVFSNDTVIAPGAEITVSLQPQAAQNQTDPTGELICKTPAKGNALKLLPAPNAKPAGQGNFVLQLKRAGAPLQRVGLP